MSPTARKLRKLARALEACRTTRRDFELVGEVADALAASGASRELLFEARLELAAAVDEDLALQGRG